MPARSVPPALEALERAAVGAPITRLGVSLFPVHVLQPLPTRVITGAPGAVEITEADAESVPTLAVTSLVDDPVLLVEGETLAGGLQQRTLNVSVLVPPRSRLDVPVSCVEASRWGGSRDFEGVSGQTSRRVRRAKAASVSRSVRETGHKHSDQMAVWASVDHELDRLDVASPTRNFADSDELFTGDGRFAEALDELVELGPLPGQCGVVAAHGSRVVSAEVYATHDLLVAHWPNLVRAALLDAIDEPRSRPSATRALRFLRRLATGGGIDTVGVGMGRERHVESKRIVGQVLTLDDAVIHASAFALAA